jgi:hypothetical protein
VVQPEPDLELRMALHIDLRAGVEGDLHLVQALLVAGLGLAHATTAGGFACPGPRPAPVSAPIGVEPVSRRAARLDRVPAERPVEVVA